MLRQGQFNPLMLMLANKLLSQVEGSPELVSEYNLLCKNMGFIFTMRKFCQQILEHSEWIPGIDIQMFRRQLEAL